MPSSRLRVARVLGLLVVLIACRPPGEEPAAGIGFRLIELPDSSRTWQAPEGPVPRPIHAMAWYPAAERSGSAMTVGDYLRYPGSTASGLEEFRTRFERESGSPLSDSLLSRWAATPVPARLNATRPPGSHPMLLLETGLNAPAFLFSDLAERLAARGIVVIAIPSFGAGPDEGLRFDSTGFATQFEDLHHVLGQSRALVPHDGVVLGGWSVGGLSAALVADDSLVDAVLSLDGALGYEYAVEFARVMGFRPACLAKPFLHLTGARPGIFRVPKSRAIFEQFPGGEAYWGTIPGLNHGDFTAFYGTRSPRFAGRSDTATVLAGMSLLEQVVSEFVLDATSGSQGWDSLVQAGPIEQLKSDSSVRASCSA